MIDASRHVICFSSTASGNNMCCRGDREAYSPCSICLRRHGNKQPQCGVVAEAAAAFHASHERVKGRQVLLRPMAQQDWIDPFHESKEEARIDVGPPHGLQGGRHKPPPGQPPCALHWKGLQFKWLNREVSDICSTTAPWVPSPLLSS